MLRWLNYLEIPWEYEPKKFPFPVKRGTMSYTPDIYLPDEDGWLEIKGALLGTDRTRLRRFKKYYPDEFSRLTVIVGNAKTPAALFFEELGAPVRAYFQDLDKQYRDIIPNWKL